VGETLSVYKKSLSTAGPLNIIKESKTLVINYEYYWNKIF